MQKFKLFPFSSVIVALAALFLVLLVTPNEAETPRERPSLPAYIERGDRVARHYDAYSRQLARYHSSLTGAVGETAPRLLVHLQPRKPILRGYQILPPITPDGGPMKDEDVHTSVAYSWPWTDHLINEEQEKIIRAEAQLHSSRTMAASQRRVILTKLALDYDTLSLQHRNLDAHIQYNRLWQAAIAANRHGYDEETALHDDIFEHQKIVDRLIRTRAAFDRANIAFKRPHRLAEMTAGLSAREALLRRRIDHALDNLNTPDFVKAEKTGNEWIIHVPLRTDIVDRAYVAAAKEIIERTWSWADRESAFRVELDVLFVSTDAMYGNQPRPATGQTLDIRRHLKHFRSGAAILTTGGLTTHVQGHAIILGPHALSPRVLAHEFGHILGFPDLYIRGYKNLAEDGFQVMEIVADPTDIMAATPQGKVLASHFARLIRHAINKSLSSPKMKMASHRPSL